MFGLTYIQFNVAEGLFWILLGVVCVLLTTHVTHVGYKTLAIFSAIALLLFGLSDFVEIAIDESFLIEARWLLWWKGTCLVAMVSGVIWYLILRLKQG